MKKVWIITRSFTWSNGYVEWEVLSVYADEDLAEKRLLMLKNEYNDGAFDFDIEEYLVWD